MSADQMLLTKHARRNMYLSMISISCFLFLCIIDEHMYRTFLSERPIHSNGPKVGAFKKYHFFVIINLIRFFFLQNRFFSLSWNICRNLSKTLKSSFLDISIHILRTLPDNNYVKWEILFKNRHFFTIHIAVIDSGKYDLTKKLNFGLFVHCNR